MQPPLSSRLRLGIIELWLAATVVLLLIATAAALRDPGLLIHMGLLNVRGFPAVCATAIPAVCGIAALKGLFQRRSSGPILLLPYSLFWLAILVAGMFAAAWRLGPAGIAQLTFHAWLVGGITFMTMLGGFVVMARWSLEHLAGRTPRSSIS
jgi:hypothetical protein